MRRGLPSIHPTKTLAALLFVLGAIWYAASSQSNAACYLLLFALSSVLLVSIPHTLLNLAGLKAISQTIPPAFAGQEVSFPVEIVNESRAARVGLALVLPETSGADERIDEIAAGKAARVVLRFPAPARGAHEIGHLCLTSAYPLGFVVSRKHFRTKQYYIVYPKPAGNPVFPVMGNRSRSGLTSVQLGEGDDFAGVRAYVPGESQRHIDWKAVARGQALMTKQFTSDADDELYLDLAAAPFSNLEDRLSQLALWIIQAERARRRYGLRLGNTVIPPSLGDRHSHQCLRALALFK